MTIACVASVSAWFRSKERPRNGILGFGRARNETRAIFERSLTIVPRSLLLNRTVTLATQARSYEDKNDTPSTLSKNHEDSQKPYSIGRYTQYLAHVWAATGTTVVSFSIFLNAINSSVGP